MTVLWVATGDDVASLVEDEDGWEVTVALAGVHAQCLTLDPHRPGELYAGTRGNGVWKSEDDGLHWRDTQLPEADVYSIAVSPADGTVYAGCEPSALFRSPDAGESWEELTSLKEIPSAPTWSFPPRPWTSHVRWIAPSPHAAELLLVGIELGGLMRSEDGGRTWSDHRPGAQRDVHALAWHPRVPGRAYEAGGGGAAWSADNGETWSPADAGRDRHYTWALAVDADDPDCWFVSASTGPFAAHRPGRAEAYIYRWRGEGPWRALDGGLPRPLDAMPYALAQTADRLYAGLNDGRVYVSADGGDSWNELALRGERPSSIAAMVSGPSSPDPSPPARR